jgi:hypothetical protein
MMTGVQYSHGTEGYVLEATNCRKGEYGRIGTWNMGQTYRHPKKLLDDHNTIRNGPECRAPRMRTPKLHQMMKRGSPVCHYPDLTEILSVC